MSTDPVRPLSFYQRGATTLFASMFDQRFSYCLYVPGDYDEAGTRSYPLVVLVHGTGRDAQGYRTAFADFCERHDCIALAPLFPAGIGEPGELSNFKYIAYEDIRFDTVLLSMVDEVAQTYRTDADRFLLYGFSGGGHFAHRFFYLHPRRLRALSIGAPGVVTLLTQDHDWWVGVRDLEERFGRALDRSAMQDVAVQMVIGGDDTETWEITLSPTHDRWMTGADLQGADRHERMRSLKQSFEAAGISVQHDIVPGVGHDGHAVLPVVKDFFADVLGHDVRGRAARQPSRSDA